MDAQALRKPLAKAPASESPAAVQSAIEIDWQDFAAIRSLGITAGASAPECLVEETMKFLATKGFDNVQELEVMPENVRFGLPPEIVEAIAAAPASATAD